MTDVLTVTTIAEELDISRERRLENLAMKKVHAKLVPKNYANDELQRRSSVCTNFCNESMIITNA
jgi:hypothetical protein